MNIAGLAISTFAVLTATMIAVFAVISFQAGDWGFGLYHSALASMNVFVALKTNDTRKSFNQLEKDLQRKQDAY